MSNVMAPMHLKPPFTNEEERQEYYQKQGLEVPPFSTLNQDVIPTGELLE